MGGLPENLRKSRSLAEPRDDKAKLDWSMKKGDLTQDLGFPCRGTGMTEKLLMMPDQNSERLLYWCEGSR